VSLVPPTPAAIVADLERLHGTTSPVAGAVILHEGIGDAANLESGVAQELSETEKTPTVAFASFRVSSVSHRHIAAMHAEPSCLTAWQMIRLR